MTNDKDLSSDHKHDHDQSYDHRAASDDPILSELLHSVHRSDMQQGLDSLPDGLMAQLMTVPDQYMHPVEQQKAAKAPTILDKLQDIFAMPKQIFAPRFMMAEGALMVGIFMAGLYMGGVMAPNSGAAAVGAAGEQQTAFNATNAATNAAVNANNDTGNEEIDLAEQYFSPSYMYDVNDITEPSDLVGAEPVLDEIDTKAPNGGSEQQ